MLANKIVAAHVHTLPGWAVYRSLSSTPPASPLLGPADPDGCYARGRDCQPLGMQCEPSRVCCCACRNAWVPDGACSPCRQLRRHRGPADVHPLPLRLVLLCKVSAGAPVGEWCSSSLADGLCCTAVTAGWPRRHTGRSTRQAASAMSLQTWLRRRSQSLRRGCAAMGSSPCCKTTRCCAARCPRLGWFAARRNTMGSRRTGGPAGARVRGHDGADAGGGHGQHVQPPGAQARRCLLSAVQQRSS